MDLSVFASKLFNCLLPFIVCVLRIQSESMMSIFTMLGGLLVLALVSGGLAGEPVEEIVKTHNDYRRGVQPTASNMLKMVKH